MIPLRARGSDASSGNGLPNTAGHHKRPQALPRAIQTRLHCRGRDACSLHELFDPCQFVERRENVLIIGQTGVGKSHLAQALGQRARSGARCSVRTRPAPAPLLDRLLHHAQVIDIEGESYRNPKSCRRPRA